MIDRGATPNGNLIAERRTTTWHPFLVAVFPILFVYSHNIEVVSVGEAVRLSAIVLVLALLLWAGVGRVLNNYLKSGLITSLFLVLFFSYGHLTGALGDFHFYLGPLYVGKNRLVIPIWTVVFLAAAWWTLRTKRSLAGLTRVLNYTAAAMVATHCLFICFSFVTQKSAASSETGTEDNLIPPEPLPNIYFIVADGYARQDVLADIYGYDNSGFIKSLRDRGFYVADRSRANYCQTSLSLASTLNMDYLDAVARRRGLEPLDKRRLRQLLQDNYVCHSLKRLGYRFVAFSTGYSYTEFVHADVYLAPSWSLTEFQNVLINTTPLPVLLRYAQPQYKVHRRRIINALDNMAAVGQTNSPSFVVANIIIPHPPFVFDKDGREIDPGRPFSWADGPDFVGWGGNVTEYISAYGDQVTYANTRLLDVIDTILAASETVPVIILESDHGPSAFVNWEGRDPENLNERMRNLNALLLPESCRDRDDVLYEELSPVNSFRVLFNCLFGTDMELLEDRSYFSTHDAYFDYYEVPETD